MRLFLLFVFLFSQVVFGQTIAYTSFEEPSTGGKYTDTGDAATDHALQNNDGQAAVNYTSTGGELGFSSYYYNTLNDVGLTDGDYVGVTDYTGTVGSFQDGTKGFQMSDIDGLMVTTLDTVDVSAYASVQVSVWYFLNDDSYESADYARIWVLLDGKDTLNLLDTRGQDIDDLGIEGEWKEVVAQISGHSKINIQLALQCNSGNEAIYFDNIKIMEGGSVNISPQVNERNVSALVPLATEDLIDTVQVFDDGTLVRVQLQYAVNDGDTVSVDMTALGYDSLYVGSIPASAYNDGDRVFYRVVAEDDQGAVTYSNEHRFFAGTTPIAQLKQPGPDQVLQYAGYFARTTGVATVSNGVFDPNNLNVYIQDEAYGAIAIFAPGAGSTEFIAGHSYTIVGEVSQYNGLSQLSPEDAQRDIIDNGEATIPDPFEVDIATLLSGPESFEGLLVRINSVDTLTGGDAWPESGVNANLLISDDGGAHELTLRIDKDTDIAGSPEPSWPQNVTGIFSQYDYSAPYDGGYQLIPRSVSDFSDATAIETGKDNLPLTLRLYPAYPNPFNPSTTLQFDMPAHLLKDGQVELAIYSVLGQKVKTLLTSAHVGTNRVVWNGTSDTGQTVAAGVYYAVLKASDLRQAVKLLLVK